MLLPHPFLTTLLFTTLWLSPALAEKALPKGPDWGSTISLTPYEVTAEKIEFSQWIKVSSPHFTLYTDSGKKEATEMVAQMEMMHQAAQFFLHRRTLNLAPTIVVLPTSRSDWRKIGNVGNVQWQVATTLVGTTRKLLLVQHDWQSDGLSPVWASLGMEEVQAMNLAGPLWFERGIADFFHTVTFTHDTITLGKQGFGAYEIKRAGWMNWPRFFSVTRQSPEFFKDSPAHNLYEAQCGIFTHYLLTNPDPACTLKLLSWAAYLDAKNDPTEESFKAIFQYDWKGWQSQLDKFLNGGRYTSGKIKFPASALQFSIVTSEPPVREMRELFVLSQILNQDTKSSDLSLDALLTTGKKTELLDELVADACHRRRRSDVEIQLLRAIIAAGSSNSTVYSQAATLLFRQSATRDSLDIQLGTEAAEIRAWCQRSLELEPLNIDANETLAWTEAYAPTIGKPNLETIVHICRTLDGNAPTDEALAALAVARWRSGALVQARSLAERIKSSALSHQPAKNLAEKLLARLDQTKQTSPESLSPQASLPDGPSH
jgi:hypothetical protein